MRKKGLVIGLFGLILWGFLYGETIFSEKISREKTDADFFKKISSNTPGLEKLDFHLQGGNFYSAYLCLSEYPGKNSYFLRVLPLVQEHFYREAEALKKSLSTDGDESLEKLPGELKLSREIFYLLLLNYLFQKNQESNLSASQAREIWLFLAQWTQQVYKNKDKTVGNLAILQISSHLFFFKGARKWGKKAKKIGKSLDKQLPSSPPYNFIFGEP